MRHLLGTDDMTHAEAIQILDTAETMAATQSRTIKKLPVLRGRTVATTFFEDSTRTRLSFEAAAKRLSADVISFSAKGSSLSKGESLKDTAQTIVAMGAEALIVRHSASGAPHRLAHCGWIDVPILNGGDGTHQHPTQALLDSFTLRRHLHTGQDKAAPEGSDLGEGDSGRPAHPAARRHGGLAVRGFLHARRRPRLQARGRHDAAGPARAHERRRRRLLSLA